MAPFMDSGRCHHTAGRLNLALPRQGMHKKRGEMEQFSRVASKRLRKLAPKLENNDIMIWGSAKVAKVLGKVRKHEFNIFDLRKYTNKPLKAVFYHAVNDFGLCESLKFSPCKLEALGDDLQASYNNNPYHGASHAADTLQNAVYMLHKDVLGAALPPLVLFGLLLAAAGHDAAHCGVRNIAVPAELEAVFGKQGSQEHMHAAVTCSLLHKSGLFKQRSAEFAEVCSIVKQLIHTTDMALHNQVNSYATCDEIKEAKEAHGLAYGKWPRKALLPLCCFVLHWADISNVARPIDISAAFAVLLGQEQSPAGAAKGNAAAAATAATAKAAAAAAAAGEAKQAAAGAAVAAAVMAAARGKAKDPLPTLKQLLQEKELAAVAVNQRGFMLNFAASTLQQLHKVLPKSAAEAQQHFDSNLARWEMIINNSSPAAS